MSFFQDHKALICAGVAGILGAGAIGYLVGRKSPKSVKAGEMFMVKSHYEEGKNPVLEYVLNNSLRETPFQRKLKEATHAYGKGVRMLGAIEEVQLFRLLLPAINARKAIEVGIYTGYTTLSLATCLPDDGKVVACDVTDEYVNDVGKKFFREAGMEHKIDLRIQPAAETLDELIANGEAGTYDFVFIDADKTSYDIYYEKSLVLLRKGGIIAVDNVLWGAKVTGDPSTMSADTLAIHNLNLKIHKDSRVFAILLPFADGVNLALKL